jgi:hypothetical protein
VPAPASSAPGKDEEDDDAEQKAAKKGPFPSFLAHSKGMSEQRQVHKPQLFRTTMAEMIPEGFFDDRHKEKKVFSAWMTVNLQVRKVAPKDTAAEEWQKFENEIEKETKVAYALTPHATGLGGACGGGHRRRYGGAGT